MSVVVGSVLGHVLVVYDCRLLSKTLRVPVTIGRTLLVLVRRGQAMQDS